MKNKIIYKEIGVKNYNSIGEIILTITPGRHLVVGENLSSKSSTSNGSGKSSIFEGGLIFTQYKKFLRSHNPSRDHKGNCKTWVNFKKADISYKAERFFKDKKEKNKFKLFMDGENKSKRKPTDTDIDFQKILNMSYEAFTSTIFILQGMPSNFGSLTPVIRKQLFEELLGQNWEIYRNLVQKRRKKEEFGRNDINGRYLSKKEEMIALNSKLETTLKLNQEDQKELKNEMVQVKKSIEIVTYEINQINQEKVNFLQGRSVDQISRDLNSLRQTLFALNNRISILNTVVQNKICPTCKRAYPEDQISTAQEEKDFLENKISKLNNTFNKKEQEKSQLDGFDTKLIKSQSNFDIYQMQLSRFLSRLSNKENNIDSQEMQKNLDSIVNVVNDIKSELEVINECVENLQYIEGLLLPSSQFRTHVLKRYIGYVNSLISEINPLIFDDVKMSLVVTEKGDGLDIHVEKKNDVDSEYKELSGGEKRKFDIVIILSFQKFLMESAGISTNLLIFDEIFEGLDSLGVQNFLSCLEFLFPEASSIYVITHQDKIKSMFDSVIKFVKKDGVTYLEGEERQTI